MHPDGAVCDAGGTAHTARPDVHTLDPGWREKTREIGRDDLIRFLAETFGIGLPADSRFRALDGDKDVDRDGDADGDLGNVDRSGGVLRSARRRQTLAGPSAADA